MRTVPFFTAFLLALACNPSPAPQSSEACVAGWWVDSTTASCACSNVNPAPECGHTDCTQFAVEGFPDGQTAVDGIITYSAQTGTISTVAPTVRRSYTLVGDHVTIAGSKDEGLTCSGDRLSTAYYYKVRATAPLSAGLNRAFASGSSTFSGVLAE